MCVTAHRPRHHPPRRLHSPPREGMRANTAWDTFHRKPSIPWSTSVPRALPPRPDERRFSQARSRGTLRCSREARSPFRGLLWPYPRRLAPRPRFRTPVVSGTTPNALLGGDAGLRLLQHARHAGTPRAPSNLARPRSRLVWLRSRSPFPPFPLRGRSRWGASHEVPATLLSLRGSHLAMAKDSANRRARVKDLRLRAPLL